MNPRFVAIRTDFKVKIQLMRAQISYEVKGSKWCPLFCSRFLKTFKFCCYFRLWTKIVRQKSRERVRRLPVIKIVHRRLHSIYSHKTMILLVWTGRKSFELTLFRNGLSQLFEIRHFNWSDEVKVSKWCPLLCSTFSGKLQIVLLFSILKQNSSNVTCQKITCHWDYASTSALNLQPQNDDIACLDRWKKLRIYTVS